MKKSRYTESQIIKVVHEVKGGKMMKDVCREYVISESTYFKLGEGRASSEFIKNTSL